MSAQACKRLTLGSSRSGSAARHHVDEAKSLPGDATQMVDRLAKAIGPKTRAVGVTWAHSSTGVRIPQDVDAQVAVRAARHGVPLGTRRRLARTAPDHSGIRSRRTRDMGRVDESQRPSTDDCRVRFTRWLLGVRAFLRDSGSDPSASNHRPRPHRGSHCRIEWCVFREGASKIPRLKLHTPRNPNLSGGISCYEIAGLTGKQVTERLAAKRIRTNE